MTHHDVAKRLAALTARGWRRLAIARGRDATRDLDGRRLLVLSPHPDDETFGCGAVISRAAAAGTPITVVVATDGRHSSPSARLAPGQLAELRTAELRAAARHLGLSDRDIVQLGYEDGTLAQHASEMAAAISALLAQHRPDVVMFPCAQDSHPDHRALHAAARRAVAAAWPSARMLAYPVWSWHEAPWFLDSPARHRPKLFLWAFVRAVVTGFVRIQTDEFLAVKRAAMAAHVSQTTNLTGEASWSFLSPAFQAAFLQRAEIFVPVAAARPGPTTNFDERSRA